MKNARRRLSAEFWENTIEAIAKQLPPSGPSLHLVMIQPLSEDTLSALLLQRRPDIHIIATREKNLPSLQDSSLDAIVSIRAFSSAYPPPDFLLETHRLLRAGGRLIVVAFIQEARFSFVHWLRQNQRFMLAAACKKKQAHIFSIDSLARIDYCRICARFKRKLGQWNGNSQPRRKTLC